MRIIIKDESVHERRKNAKSIREKFVNEKTIGTVEGLVSPEEILGVKPKFSSDYFKEKIKKYG